MVTKTLSQTKTRELLRSTPDGMTPRQLSEALGINQPQVRRALRAMPDAFVDRWVECGTNNYAAVWCAVVPPEDCPHPREG